MIDAIRVLVRVITFGVFVTAFSWGSSVLAGPASAPAIVDDDVCFTDPVPTCADTIMQRALTLLDAITNETDRDRERVTFASAQSRRGDVAGALKNVDAIRDPASRKSALTHVLTNMALSGNTDETLALAETYGGGWYTGHALYAISAQQAISGDIKTARSTARSIRQDDRRVKALQYVVGKQISSGDLAGARDTIKDEKNGEIRSQVLLTIAGAHLNSYDLDSAIDVLGEITEESLRSELLSGFAETLAKIGDYREAIGAAFRIKTTQERDVALNRVASYLTFAGDFETALAIAKEVADDAIRNEIKVRIAVVRAEAGNFDQALADVGDLQDTKYSDEALHRIAMKLLLQRNTARAIAVAAEIQDNALKAEIRKLAGQAEYRDGNEEKAMSIARGADQRAAQVQSLLAIAEEQQNAFLTPKEIFLEVEGLIGSAGNQKIRDGMLLDFSISLSQMQYFKRAINTAQKVKAPQTRGKAKTIIADALAFQDKHERAAKLLASIDDPKIRTDALQSFATDAATKGKTSVAMGYSRNIDDPGRRAFAYSYVAGILLSQQGK